MVLLDLMGGVALLLWGLHMVHSGILRAFGPDLRLLLAKGLSNRFTAFAAGLGLTALLQSSTATALITSSFTSEGLVSLVPALAIMLGANVGTTLIVQLLSFNISAVAPILFLVGLVAFPTLTQALIPPVLYLAMGVLEGHFITPSIMGHRLTLHPLTVFLSLIFWTWLWGPVGAFLAVPLLIIGVVAADYMFPKEEPALPD